MSCNGCRVLRKGCSETCVLRPCLQWIESPEAQGHATVFVAKFFGRAGLMSFISNVPENQRPALFQSLLFEAAGRTVNPVNGAVGLLWTGNWQVCQAAVDTVLRGGALKPIPDLLISGAISPETDEGVSGCTDGSGVLIKQLHDVIDPSNNKRRRFATDDDMNHHQQQYHPRTAKNITQLADLDLSLTPRGKKSTSTDKMIGTRLGSPSMNSDDQESAVTTTPSCTDHHHCQQQQPPHEMMLLNLFN